MNGEGLGFVYWFAIAAVVLVVGAMAGLTIYGGRVEPVSQHYEQVVLDDRLPH
jgi:hypothetical protein